VGAAESQGGNERFAGSCALASWDSESANTMAQQTPHNERDPAYDLFTSTHALAA